MKQVEERYEANKMAYRDIKNSIDTAKREGRIEANIETCSTFAGYGTSNRTGCQSDPATFGYGSKSELLIKAKTNVFLLCRIP